MIEMEVYYDEDDFGIDTSEVLYTVSMCENPHMLVRCEVAAR